MRGCVMDSDDRAFKAGQLQERQRIKQIIEIRLDQLSRTPRCGLLCAELQRLSEYLKTP
jgi:hypothetical protein